MSGHSAQKRLPQRRVRHHFGQTIKQIPAAQLWGGRPATFMRDLSDDELAHNRWLTQGYVDQSREYLKARRP